jgi:hypothetical protein
MAAPTRQGFSNLLSKMEQRDKQGTDVFPALAIGSGFAPSAGISDVLGFAPDPFNPGQTLPSFSENVDRGNYLDAGLQTLGAGGDVMLAAAPFAPVLLAPAAAMKLTSQLGKALRGGSRATKAVDDIKPGQTLYRYEKSEYSSPDTGAIFYSPDKSYAELYNSDSSLLKTSKVPDKFLDIRTNSGQEKAINWINKEIDKLEKAEIPRTSQDIKLAKQFLKQKDAQGISSSLANLNIIYSKQLNTKINPGLAEKKMMGSLDFDAMTIREAGRDGKEDFSIAFRKNPSTKAVDDVKPGDIAKVVPPTDKSDGIFAFHGSAADFDEFKLSKIGTGEGAQAFGYGLYFTDSKDIAKFYKTHLSKEVDIDGKPFIRGNKHYPGILKNESLSDNLSSTNGDLEKAIKYIEETVNEMKELKNVNGIETYSKELKDLKELRGKVKVRENTGKTYEVNIKTVKDDLLDYDKPLSEQSKIFAKLEKYFGARDLDVFSLKNKGKDSEKLTGRELYGLLQNKLGKESMEKVERINKKLSQLNKVIDANSVGYRNFTSPVGEKAAKQYDNLLTERDKIPRGRFDDKVSDILNKLGIKGIKYEPGQLTPGGQNKTKGESNFVIFDDKIIDIMAKYGIVGAISVSAMQRGSGASERDILPPGQT